VMIVSDTSVVSTEGNRKLFNSQQAVENSIVDYCLVDFEPEEQQLHLYWWQLSKPLLP
jgi:hypothetical protein